MRGGYSERREFTTQPGWADDPGTYTRSFYDTRGVRRLTFTNELISTLGPEIMRKRYGMEVEDSVMSRIRVDGAE